MNFFGQALYPVVFPTVTFRLEATPELPEGGWIGICGLPDRRIENCITVEEGEIELTEEEQDAVWAELDRQCKEHLGRGCEELLSESRERMD